MKTQEELASLKEEYETLNRKLSELTDEELKHVTGGVSWTELSGENLIPSVSRESKESSMTIIEDPDMAKEATGSAQAQVCQQAAQAMLASRVSLT